MMSFLHYLLALAVLVTLVATLMYVTKAIKAKEDKDEKNACIKKAALFFLGYLMFNAVRLYVESGPK
jgi:hypothetical protein